MSQTNAKNGIVSKYDENTLRGVVRVGLEKFNFDATVYYADGRRRPPKRGDHVEVIFSSDKLVMVRAVDGHQFAVDFFAPEMRKEFLTRLQKMKKGTQQQEQRAVASKKFEEAIKAQAYKEILDDLIEIVSERMWEV